MAKVLGPDFVALQVRDLAAAGRSTPSAWAWWRHRRAQFVFRDPDGSALTVHGGAQ